ncbi:MAG: HAMP domain-containing sensor histidine kinase [Xanthomonadales bacterium]
MGQKPTAVSAAHPTIDDLDVLQHELGNVVHGVVCVAELLRESGLDAQQRRWLTTIDQACGQIRGILAHARQARQDSAVAPGPVRLNGVALLEDTLLAHAPLAAGAGVELLLRIAPRLPAYWRSDPCRLRQLLDNLVGNAIRYARNGTVMVEAVARPGDSDALIIRVLDSGPGVEDAEGLFEAYRRGFAGRHGPRGSGLGLYICRCIAETLGGVIRCRNRRSGGASFEVRLPRTLQGDLCDWPPLQSLAPLSCRLELDADRERCVGALLDRLGVRWGTADAPPRAVSDRALSCVIRRRYRGAGSPGTGLVIVARRPGAAARTVHVPGPVLESSLESALYRLSLDARLA